MTIHHFSTRARSAPLTDGRGRVQAKIDIASTPARSAAVTSSDYLAAGAGVVSQPSAEKTSSADS